MAFSCAKDTDVSGKELTRIDIPAYKTVNLYVVKFRPSKGEKIANSKYISLADRYNGVETHKYGEEWRSYQSGHDAGSLHEVIESPVLTWSLEPGDELLHKLTVKVYGVRSIYWLAGKEDDAPENELVSWDRATCSPYNRRVLVLLTGAPGRSASLGEDGLEDCYGRDVLADQLSLYLRGETSPCLCNVAYELLDTSSDTRIEVQATR